MAQDESEIRQAIEQTRDNIGETLQAIGHKADVKARASEMVAEARDSLRGSATEAKDKLGEAAQRVQQRLPDSARPVVASTAEWAKSAVQPGEDMRRRHKVAILTGLATATLVLLARHARRHKVSHDQAAL
jgi:Protein of unknown function (DUF3618)